MTAEWCWSVVWLGVLLLIVWPLSLVAAILFILISPFSACFLCTSHLTEFLYKGMVLPLKISTLAVAGKTPDHLSADIRAYHSSSSSNAGSGTNGRSASGSANEHRIIEQSSRIGRNGRGTNTSDLTTDLTTDHTSNSN